MTLTIRKLAMPEAKIPVKCPYIMNPTRIVIHNTVNDASAENEIRYMQSNSTEVSFHYAVDDIEAVQGVELWRNAWHATDGATGKGNREGIAIEICYSKSGGDRFLKAEENAAELAAKLLLDFEWGIDRITKHQDYAAWKNCPHRTLELGWDRFVGMVERKRREMLDAMAGNDAKPEDSGSVTLNGYSIVRASDFSIVYWDKSKRKGTAASYINGGFFGNFKEGITAFTLPVGNLVCDVTPESTLKYAAEKYWKPYNQNGKFRYGTNDNASPQFKGKAVTTFVIPYTGRPYMKEMPAPPSTCRYAISGIPVIRNGVRVNYASVMAQGWDESPFYATSRNLLGLKGSAVYIVSGKSKTDNFVSSWEICDAVKDFGFTDVLALDGGGSYYRKVEGKADSVLGDREIHNIIVF